MLKITSIRRLITATSNPSHVLTPAVSSQIGRIRDRLESGIDYEGNAFAPYKNPERYDRPRPLYRAYKLFDHVAFSTEGFGSDTIVKGTITGIAAKIANYQNIHRIFARYSLGDRREILEELVGGLKGAMKNGVK